MKTTFIRSLVLAILASSISAFAATGAGKSEESTASCPPAAANSSQQTAKQSKTDKKSKKDHEQKQEVTAPDLSIYG
jgi:hypothetical protein